MLTGLLALPSSFGEMVPGRTTGLDVMSTTGEERRPLAFSGDEMTGFGDIEFPGKSAGDGLDDVGLASLRGDENCVPRNSCEVGSSWDRLFRKGF